MNESFLKTRLRSKHARSFVGLLVLIVLPGCEIFHLRQAGDSHYGSGSTPYYNATRAVDYTRDLADQLESLAPKDALIGAARTAADNLDAAIRAMPNDPNAGGGQFLLRLTQALAAAGAQAGSVASTLEALTGTRGGLPPGFPNDPSFSQSFTSVHGSKGDQK